MFCRTSVSYTHLPRLAKELGGVSTFQGSDYDEYGARLIVLLGADYAGPGSDQLVVPEPAAE